MKARLLLPLVALLAAGCGGGGPRATRGAAVVRAAWPASGRMIPTAAQSIQVQALDGATVVNAALLTPSSPTATFDDVPVGTITFKATAYPNADGTGNAMAAASVSQAITAGDTANISLTMASTIDHLTIAPSPIVLHLLGLFTQQLTVTAYDASNAVVLTAPTDISYATTNSLLFNVDSSGFMLGLSLGNATVTATDAISGKSATASVQIAL